MGISLLPDELKKREEEEMAKVKAAMSAPGFKMHRPQSGLNGKPARVMEGQSGGAPISFGAEAPVRAERSAFRIIKKEPPVSARPLNQPASVQRPPVNFVKPEKPVPPAIPNIPRPAPQAEPLKILNVPAAPRATVDKGFRMHVPEVKREDAAAGTKVIRETKDKIEDVKRPPRFMETLRRKIPFTNLKTAPTDVDLIAEDYQGVVAGQFWRRGKQLLIIGLAAVILFALGYAAVQAEKINLLKKYQATVLKINQTESEINSFSVENKQLESLKSRAKALEGLLAGHVYWTILLDKLEHVTLESVRYYNLTAESNGDILLSAKAKKYEDAAAQLAVLEKADFVSSAEVNSLTQTPPTELKPAPGAVIFPVEFTIKLKLKSGVLNKPNNANE